MSRNSIRYRIAFLGVVPALIIACAILFVSNRPQETKVIVQPTPTPLPTPDGTHILDQSLGLDFYITKDFIRVDDKTMHTENPFYLYQFKPQDVDNVSCTVSQTVRIKPGAVAIKDLIAGTMSDIIKTNKDAKLISAEDITMVSGVHGGWIELTLTDKVASRRLEVVATNDTRTTFAFCTSPQSLFEGYRTKFEAFLNSLSVQ